MTLRAEQFYGVWSLRDWRIDYMDGRITYPFGEEAKGQIIYSPDGAMSATISSAIRHGLPANVRQATDREKAGSFDRYFHYAGHWHIEGDSVIHTVTLSLNPNFVGTRQVRKAVFEEKSGLTLSASETLQNGTMRHHILQWQKSN